MAPDEAPPPPPDQAPPPPARMDTVELGTPRARKSIARDGDDASGAEHPPSVALSVFRGPSDVGDRDARDAGDARPDFKRTASSASSRYDDEAWYKKIDVFTTASRIERVLMSYCPGRLLLLGFALASPVDLALDVRMGVLLANIDATALLPVMLFSFLYLGLRLQVLLLLGTSEAAATLSRGGETYLDSFLAFFASWHLPLTEFSAARVAVAWAPFGLQISQLRRDRRLDHFARSLFLEVLYAPLALVLGVALVVYGSLYVSRDLFCGGVDFWRSSAARQVRMVRATLISIVATSVTAVPQIIIQSIAYVSHAVPLTPAAERIVVASISFSVLSLFRSICGLLASWRRIHFTWQRVNRNLEEEVFNAVLHECADTAESGDSIAFSFGDGDHGNAPDRHLSMLREMRLVDSERQAADTPAKALEETPTPPITPADSVHSEDELMAL